MSYGDRIDAGKQPALRLGDYANRDDPLVIALPRGGVPMAIEVAKALRAPRGHFSRQKTPHPATKSWPCW